jgi:hypothetical protein
MLWDERIDDRRCAQCWGVVVSRLVDEDQGPRSERKIVCLKDCQPGGHVSATYVELAKRQDHDNHLEVAKNYPELSGYVPPTEEEIEEMSNTLFGE